MKNNMNNMCVLPEDLVGIYPNDSLMIDENYDFVAMKIINYLSERIFYNWGKLNWKEYIEHWSKKDATIDHMKDKEYFDHFNELGTFTSYEHVKNYSPCWNLKTYLIFADVTFNEYQEGLVTVKNVLLDSVHAPKSSEDLIFTNEMRNKYWQELKEEYSTSIEINSFYIIEVI